MNDVSVIDFVCEDDAVIAATLFHTVLHPEGADAGKKTHNVVVGKNPASLVGNPQTNGPQRLLDPIRHDERPRAEHSHPDATAPRICVTTSRSNSWPLSRAKFR